jgi:hypothetical protein
MRILTLLLALASLSFAAPARAQEEAGGMTVAKLVTIKNMRCDALQRGKRARLQADVYRTEAGNQRGQLQLAAEQNVANAEAEAGAAFEEAQQLKKRLDDMFSRFVSEQRLKWYETSDEAERLRLEELINEAKALVDEACAK